MATLSPQTITQFAQRLDTAAQEIHEIERLTLECPSLNLNDAYKIQAALLSKKIARGEKLVGLKMGLTSKAKMQQMGVEKPIYGHLTHASHIRSGEPFALAPLIHPKIEAEIAFILGKDLKGPCTPEQALKACEIVCGAFEIIDSRFKDFKFELPDVIADNCSAARFSLGEMRGRPSELDIGNLGMIVEVNGVQTQFASSSAILGHPANSLAALANLLAERDAFVPAGSIVLSGSSVAALPMHHGDHFKLFVQDLGEVECLVEQSN